MNPQQAFFRFGPPPIHRYQVLDGLFEEEELISSLSHEKVAPVSQAACRPASNGLVESAYQAPSGNPYAKIEDSSALPKEMISRASQASASVAFLNATNSSLRVYSFRNSTKKAYRLWGSAGLLRHSMLLGLVLEAALHP